MVNSRWLVLCFSKLCLANLLDFSTRSESRFLFKALLLVVVVVVRRRGESSFSNLTATKAFPEEEEEDLSLLLLSRSNLTLSKAEEAALPEEVTEET